MERCKGLHCLLLIHLIMTSLCLGRIGLSSLSGLCGGLRCVEFFCCLGRNTKQMKNLQAAALLCGIFEGGETSKGQKLWMVQTCQNWPDEESCDTFCLQACRAFDIFFFFCREKCHKVWVPFATLLVLSTSSLCARADPLHCRLCLTFFALVPKRAFVYALHWSNYKLCSVA